MVVVVVLLLLLLLLEVHPPQASLPLLANPVAVLKPRTPITLPRSGGGARRTLLPSPLTRPCPYTSCPRALQRAMTSVPVAPRLAQTRLPLPL